MHPTGHWSAAAGGRNPRRGSTGGSRAGVLTLAVLLVALSTVRASPLLEATHQDDTPAALQLLAAGADATGANRYGSTPLSVACTNGNAEVIAALLGAGADPNKPVNGDRTPLMTAARTGKIPPVRLLLEAGAAVGATDRGGQTALMWAAADGHAGVVRLLLERGADPNKTLKSGFAPLHFAAREGHREVLGVLLGAGVDPDVALETDRRGRNLPLPRTSSLVFAIENGHFDLAVDLLDAGADPNDARTGHAPLHILTWVRKPNRGDDEDGMPPPGGSGRRTSLDLVRALVEHGAEVDLQLEDGSTGGHRLGSKGATSFLYAAKTADLPLLQLLLELGADPHLPNADGTTPLMAAAGQGTNAPTEEAGTEDECLQAVAFLLTLDADLDTVDKNGETAMHGAAYKSLPEMVRYLDAQGADIEVWNRKNKRGWTPLVIAQGFRPGNFKPSPETVEAISEVMLAHGITPPPPPERTEKKGY
ncbi:ankyrin repeat domain-containing protein [soil metagenome]